MSNDNLWWMEMENIVTISYKIRLHQMKIWIFAPKFQWESALVRLSSFCTQFSANFQFEMESNASWTDFSGQMR